MIYVERTMQNGTIRRGLVGKLDLEAYDYEEGSISPVRATEKTVKERIPLRMSVRRCASIEFSLVLMRCDDSQDVLLGLFTENKEQLKKLYDFDLMQDGGHLAGWLIEGEELAAFEQRLADYEAEIREKYLDLTGEPVIIIAGDGNHSLATAKSCYVERK